MLNKISYHELANRKDFQLGFVRANMSRWRPFVNFSICTEIFIILSLFVFQQFDPHYNYHPMILMHMIMILFTYTAWVFGQREARLFENGITGSTRRFQGLLMTYITAVMVWASAFGVIQHSLHGSITIFLAVVLLPSFIFLIPDGRMGFAHFLSLLLIFVGLYIVEPSLNLRIEHYFVLSIFQFTCWIISVFNYGEFVTNIKNNLDIKEKGLLLVEANLQLIEAMENQIRIQKELEIANARLADISTLDALTGIPNRRKLEESLEDLWIYAVGNQKSMTVMMIDIDLFKNYNDTYGHVLGDDCLQKVAVALQQCVRKGSDFVARFGGEEFVFAAVGLSYEEAQTVGEKLRMAVESLRLIHSAFTVSRYVTVSVGICWCEPGKKDQLQEALEKADLAMYEAKRNGRNQVRTSKPLSPTLFGT